jgi:hypothetical protein
MGRKMRAAISSMFIFLCACASIQEHDRTEESSGTTDAASTDPTFVTDAETSKVTDPSDNPFSTNAVLDEKEFFIIQVAAVSDPETARRVSSELDQMGYLSFHENVQRADGRNLIRIRIGVFSTAWEASYSIEQLSRSFKKPMLIKVDRIPQGAKDAIRIDPERLSQVERSILYGHQLDYLQASLGKVAKRCLSEIDIQGFMTEADRVEWKRHFIKSQTLWKELLETDALTMEMEMHGGSGAGLSIQAYQIRYTADRIQNLKERYGLN